MSHVKLELRKAREAINAKDWQTAESSSQKVLSFEPSNYNANVFLGLSRLELGYIETSEIAYKNAIKQDESNLLAWQGLLAVYDRAMLVDSYITTATKIAYIYKKQDDHDKCATMIQQVLRFTRETGNPKQLVGVLEMLLPSGPFQSYLEGAISPPAEVLLEMAALLETEESTQINREINSRKTRLGAKLADVTNEVKQEVFLQSRLSNIYNQIITYSPHEEIRREYESKLLFRGYEILLVLPDNKKPSQRDRVRKLGSEIVTIKSPVLLAYQIQLEWRDRTSLRELDINLVHDFIDFFPSEPLSNTLRAYLNSELSDFQVESLEDDESVRVEEDIIDLLVEALQNNPESIIAHRVLCEYYLSTKEYELVGETARTGLSNLQSLTKTRSLYLPKNFDTLSAMLGTSYVYYQAPKHHLEAEQIFDRLLKKTPNDLAALLGRGLIFQERSERAASRDAFLQACKAHPTVLQCQAEYGWSLILLKEVDNGKRELESVLKKLDERDLPASDLKGTILWRIGQCLWESNVEGRKDRDGAYSYFVKALNSNSSYAPAFTSIGIFYELTGDHDRASKCFQRAFELDANELVAAKYLANGFANSHEWDLVEIIARRAADADKKRTIPGHELTWPQRALGVVELNNHNYLQAIQYFQTSLRVDNEDFNAWLGLGESYLGTGKYIAATKAFNKARSLDSTNWFAQYLLGTVQRDLSEYETAASTFRVVLATRPDEFGALTGLVETLILGAFHWLRKGYYSRACDYAIEAIEPIEHLAQTRREALDLWKQVADGVAIFTYLQGSSEQYPFERLEQLLNLPLGEKQQLYDNSMDSVDGVSMRVFLEASSTEKCLYGSILAAKKNVLASTIDKTAHAAAWYNLGWTEYRCYSVLRPRKDAYRQAAVRCFRRAIKLESRNAEFWNALGCAIGSAHVRVAQHCFVRSLNIYERNPQPWTNLATLYMLADDLQLSNEAFSRAQSVDPEYPLCWVGQGFLAQLYDKEEEARGLFEHAASISDDFFSLVKSRAALAIFDGVQENLEKAVASPMYLLEKLLRQNPKELGTLQLFSFFLERDGQFDAALSQAAKLCDQLEARYEELEDDEDLLRFAHAKADMARVSLAAECYDEAFAQATEALDLLESSDASREVSLSAHLTAGIAAFCRKDLQTSLGMFEEALAESGEDADVVALLSQVLWAKGGKVERDVAREQLLSK